MHSLIRYYFESRLLEGLCNEQFKVFGCAHDARKRPFLRGKTKWRTYNLLLLLLLFIIYKYFTTVAH
jgi:hypothetical protein